MIVILKTFNWDFKDTVYFLRKILQISCYLRWLVTVTRRSPSEAKILIYKFLYEGSKGLQSF